MKRFIALMLVLAASFVANASYLYWQLEEAPAGIEGATVGAIWAKKGDTYQILTSSYDGGSGTYVPAPNEMNEYSADLSVLGGNLADWSFFIELKNGTVGSPGTTVGFSNYMTYSEAASNISATGALIDMPLAVWHGDTYAAPEPTSAMLMLLGTAFLGLRRRQRSAA